MPDRNVPARRKILNKKLILTVVCLYFLVYVVGCSGYRVNGVALNSSNHPMYADSGQLGTDANKNDDDDDDGGIVLCWLQKLILAGLALLFAGVIIYIINDLNEDGTTSNGGGSLPPPPPLP